MKAAFATWNDRIAPVFDVSGRIHVVEIEAGRIVREVRRALTEDVPIRKALSLAELGVEVLVCGAISRSLYGQIVSTGIRVVPFVAGDLRDVIDAWRKGALSAEAFAMPGCCGRWGRHFETPGSVFGTGGRSHRKEAWRAGTNGFPSPRPCWKGFPGPGKTHRIRYRRVLCMPRCGLRDSPEKGVPCSARRCPKCGTIMKRV